MQPRWPDRHSKSVRKNPPQICHQFPPINISLNVSKIKIFHEYLIFIAIFQDILSRYCERYCRKKSNLMTFLYKLMGKAVLAVRINAVEFGEQKIINGNFDDYFKIKLLVF